MDPGWSRCAAAVLGIMCSRSHASIHSQTAADIPSLKPNIIHTEWGKREERRERERERERERGNILGKTANRHELQREEEEEESKSNRHVIRLTEPTIFADAAARTLLCRVPQHVSGRLNITATNLCCFATP
jgi:hypothetical protein